jgi:hypothetical protein
LAWGRLVNTLSQSRMTSYLHAWMDGRKEIVSPKKERKKERKKSEKKSVQINIFVIVFLDNFDVLVSK